MIPEAFLLCALSLPSLSQRFSDPHESFAHHLAVADQSWAKTHQDYEARWLVYGSYQRQWANIVDVFPGSVWLSPFAHWKRAVRGVITRAPFKSASFRVVWFASATPARKWKAAYYTAEIERILEPGGYLAFYESVNLAFPELLIELGFKRTREQFQGMNIWKKRSLMVAA